MKILNTKIISLSEVAIIGKEGLCTKDCNVVGELWKNVNNNFPEVLELG